MKHLFTLFVLILFVSANSWSSFATAAVILQYHHVSDETPPVTSISPKQFLAHMTYLQEQQFNVISLPALMEKINQRKPIADKTIVLTFDDGYISVWDHARPILKKFDWPYTVFINPKFIDGKYSRHMSWQQLNQIATEKATLANHTMYHKYLSRKPAALSQQQWLLRIEKDIKLAESRILAQTGQNHKMLAYPYGEFDLAVKSKIKQMGYTAFGQHSGALGHLTDLTRIPRFPASGIYAKLESLSLKMASLAFPVVSLHNANPVLSQNPPILGITVKVEDFLAKNVQCFSAGHQLATVNWTASNHFEVSINQPLPSERSRYNCTAPSISKPGRFYWFSQPWINLP